MLQAQSHAVPLYYIVFSDSVSIACRMAAAAALVLLKPFNLRILALTGGILEALFGAIVIDKLEVYIR